MVVQYYIYLSAIFRPTYRNKDIVWSICDDEILETNVLVPSGEDLDIFI